MKTIKFPFSKQLSTICYNQISLTMACEFYGNVFNQILNRQKKDNTTKKGSSQILRHKLLFSVMTLEP